MLHDIYEFFFCPVHGVFRVQMWPVAAITISGLAASIRSRCKR